MENVRHGCLQSQPHSHPTGIVRFPAYILLASWLVLAVIGVIVQYHIGDRDSDVSPAEHPKLDPLLF